MKRFALGFTFCVLDALILTGCGGGGSSSGATNNGQSSVFVTGEDAPLPSVLALNLTLNSISLNNSSSSAPLAVQTGDGTNFININGLAGLQAAGAAKVVSRGLVFKDPNTGAPQMWAHRVRVLP
jgi:hypothetical protein